MTWVILTPMFQRLDGGYYVMFFAFIAADTRPILSMFPLIFMLDLKDLFLWKIKQSNNERLICKQFSLLLFYS